MSRVRAWRWQSADVAGLYLLLGLLLTAPLWRDPAGREIAGNPHDTDLYSWWLSWVSHATLHGQLGFITKAMNAPVGVSALWNTSVLAPGVLLSPLTALAGGQVTYTVLILIAFSGSAYTAFVLLTKHSGVSGWPNVLGGAVFGFSPAMVHASIGHLSLLFAPLVPLLIGATLDLCRRRVPPIRGGLWLGALAAAQLFTGEELVYDTVLVVAGLLLVLAVRSPTAVPTAARSLARAVPVAAAVGVALTGYALAVQLFGPLHEQGSPFAIDFFKADLAGFVTPSSLMWQHSDASAAAAVAFPGGAPEYLTYLGWPLVLLIVALLLLRAPLKGQMRLAAGCTFALGVICLGAHLMYHGVSSQIPGPWYVLRHLPLAENILPNRFALYMFLSTAWLITLTIDQVRTLSLPQFVSVHRHRINTAAAVAVAAALLVPIIPRPLPVIAIPNENADTANVLRHLPVDQTVLVLPFPTAVDTAALRWQAAAGFRYNMPGGFFIGPAGDGHAFISGPGPRPTQQLLTQPDATPNTPTAITASSRQNAAADLAYWHVSTIVLTPSPHSAQISQIALALFGPPTQTVGQVQIWQHATAQAR